MSSHTQARETGLIHFSLAEEIKDAFLRQQMTALTCLESISLHSYVKWFTCMKKGD